MKILVVFFLVLFGLNSSFSQTVTGHITCEVLDYDPTLSVQCNSALELGKNICIPSVLKISGQPNYLYGITTPSKVTIAKVDGISSVQVNDICTPSKEGVLDTDGKATISIEATLVAGNNQIAYYANTKDFLVTINYN